MLLHPSKIKVPAVSIPRQCLILSSKACLCSSWSSGLWGVKTFAFRSVRSQLIPCPLLPSVEARLSLGQGWRGKEMQERGVQHFPEPLSAPCDHLQSFLLLLFFIIVFIHFLGSLHTVRFTLWCTVMYVSMNPYSVYVMFIGAYSHHHNQDSE